MLKLKFEIVSINRGVIKFQEDIMQKARKHMPKIKLSNKTK